MDPKLHEALNDHLELEFEAAHVYRAMACWFDLHDLPGFAAWMTRQSNEELAHAQRFIDHLLERDCAPKLPAVPQPPTEWESPLAAVESVLESEQRVTAAILSLCDVAERSNDRATQILLQWFVTEQMEEENLAKSVLGRLRLAGDSGPGLIMVDQEVGRGEAPGMEEAGGAE